MDHRTPLTLRDVSAHRSVLYGFAALWIMVFHMQSKPQGLLLAPLAYFQMFGACGVEIFVLLSGPGLYRSLEREPRVRAFYLKRFQRVFLPSFIVAAISFALNPGGVLRYGASVLFFPYWLGVNTFWYVAFILTMYLIYPALHALQRRCPKAMWGLFALSVVFALLISLMSGHWAENCRRGVSRVPIFLLGCILAPRFERGERIPRWVGPAALAGAALLFGVSRVTSWAGYFVRSMCFICLSVFLIIAITALCRRCSGRGVSAFVYRCFAFCGGISLEIYLLYTRVTALLFEMPAYVSGQSSMLKLELAAIPATLLLGWLLTRLCRELTEAFCRVPIPGCEKN